MSDYYEHVAGQNGAGLWRTVATGACGLLVGTALAWATAVRDKGVSVEELHDYTQKYSPYAFDKQSLTEHNAQQDKDIGINSGKLDRVFERLATMENKQATHDRDLTDLHGKLQLVGDALELQRKQKP